MYIFQSAVAFLFVIICLNKCFECSPLNKNEKIQSLEKRQENEDDEGPQENAAVSDSEESDEDVQEDGDANNGWFSLFGWSRSNTVGISKSLDRNQFGRVSGGQTVRVHKRHVLQQPIALANFHAKKIQKHLIKQQHKLQNLEHKLGLYTK